MTQDEKDPESAAALLADWRSAQRDNLAAHSAASVAQLALEAASAATTTPEGSPGGHVGAV